MKAVVVLVLALLMGGCFCAPDVVVRDTGGNPIAGAEVVGISLSVNGQAVITNEKGEAKMPWAAQKTKWIVVRKQHYVSSDSINIESVGRPIEVYLQLLAINPDNSGNTRCNPIYVITGSNMSGR